MSYIGQNLPTDVFGGYATDTFAGDGSATTFTLSQAPFNEQGLIVVINNVIQQPTTNYTVSGTTLTIVGTAVASGDVIYARHTGVALPIGEANALDLQGQSDKLILDADADTTISADTDDQIDIKVGGTDVVTLTNSSLALKGTTPTLTIGDAGAEDTKIVFDGNAQDFYVGLDDSADDLVIGVGSTLGTTAAINITEDAHVVVGASLLSNFGIPTAPQFFSATSNTTNAANDLTTVGANVATNNIGVINDSNSGILSSIGMETRVSGAGRAAIHNMWQTTYQSDLVFRLRTGSGSSGELFRINSGEQNISTGGETSPDAGFGGLTLQQADLDDNILTCKSSDVAHGVTGYAEADTFFQIKKLVSASGGAVLRGWTEGEQAIQIFGAAESANTTKSTSGEGICAVTAYVRSGTSPVDPGSDANLFVVNQGGNAKFIVDTEGQLHSDGGAQSAYDTYEDAQLVRAFDLSHGRGVIDSKFDKFISYNHEKLADMKLVGREEDGTPNHFINVTGMQRLHNGAIWQQYEKHQKLASAFYKLAEKTIGKEEADKLLTDEEIELLN